MLIENYNKLFNCCCQLYCYNAFIEQNYNNIKPIIFNIVQDGISDVESNIEQIQIIIEKSILENHKVN